LVLILSIIALHVFKQEVLRCDLFVQMIFFIGYWWVFNEMVCWPQYLCTTYLSLLWFFSSVEILKVLRFLYTTIYLMLFYKVLIWVLVLFPLSTWRWYDKTLSYPLKSKVSVPFHLHVLSKPVFIRLQKSLWSLCYGTVVVIADRMDLCDNLSSSLQILLNCEHNDPIKIGWKLKVYMPSK
jgi:hypothetical protein